MGITSSFISHQIWLQRNASHEVNELLPFVQQMRDTVRTSVLLFGDEDRTRRNLEQLLKRLSTELDSIAGSWSATLTDDLKTFLEYETGWVTNTISAEVNTDLATPSIDQAWAAATFNPVPLGESPTTLSRLIDSWGDNEVNRLVTGVKTGFIQGRTTRQIIREVVGPGGLGDVSQRHAATVVRTALNHVSNQAREQVYKKNRDIVTKYMIVATLDSRTSNVCRGLDGRTYNVGEGPLPPFHGNCRTTTKPVLSSDYDFLDTGAKRAARGAEGGTQVDANTTYYEFLAQQPAWFQDQALGPTRGAIFRSSGMTPEEFRAASIDGFGRPLTLAEMAAVDQRVAEYLKTKGG
jgi:SPP1 gp7 family putative phage head morphogenesis protein